MVAIAWVKTLADFSRHPTRRSVKDNHGYVLRDNELPGHAEDVVYWMNKCNQHKGMFVVLYDQENQMGIRVSYAKAVSALKQEAKKYELMFRRQSCTIDGIQCYEFVDRSTKETIVNNMPLRTAYDLYVRGKISKLRKR